MMDFPLSALLDPQCCYDFLVPLLHLDGLRCPHGHAMDRCYVHKRDRAPILDYRCKFCGRCFNIFSDTVLQGTKYNAVHLVQLLRGIAQGVPTARLAREMRVDRKWLLRWRYQLQHLAAQARRKAPLADEVTETDELY